MLCTLLDAARMGNNMLDAKQLQPNHLSLYKGLAEENLSEYGPYLFATTDADPFHTWFMDKGWGNAWGLGVESRASFGTLTAHFKKLIVVSTEDGEEMYFRFYDPRVLRIFLPTCPPRQLPDFFGPVQSFFLEDDDPAYCLRYWLDADKLVTQRELILASQPG